MGVKGGVKFQGHTKLGSFSFKLIFVCILLNNCMFY